MSDAIEQAALRLREAGEKHQPCAPIRDLIAPTDVASAYAVQEINTTYWLGRGRKLVGRKIGLTAVAVQKQLGVDQPDFGLLFDDMLVSESHAIPAAELMQPKVEAEIAIVLKKPLSKPQHSVADIADATDYACAAIEIVGSRIANWDIKLADTVADNASSSHFVLGARKVRLADTDLVNCAMTMVRRGETVSTGSGAACMGNPLNAAVWLADTMVKYGRPLQAGDVIMTGALGPMVAVAAGDVVEARIEGLGQVRATFGH
ncbi:MAG TPA: fumarylacetoacetate hydrolase family protein [Stellaceae bacterium]|jgi:2-keto-4-pentenoate hydratase